MVGGTLVEGAIPGPAGLSNSGGRGAPLSLGLHIAEKRWRIIALGGARKALTVNHAARELQISRQAAHELLRRMEADGLLSSECRTPHTLQFRVTDAGKRMLEVARAHRWTNPVSGP